MSAPIWQPDNIWDEHPEYTAVDWAWDVNQGDTRLGYIDWVNHHLTADD